MRSDRNYGHILDFRSQSIGRGRDGDIGSRRGTSPLRSHGTVRDTLASYGSCQWRSLGRCRLRSNWQVGHAHCCDDPHRRHVAGRPASWHARRHWTLAGARSACGQFLAA